MTLTLSTPCVAEALLDNICSKDRWPYPSLVAKFGAVSRLWRMLLAHSLRLLPVLSFSRAESRVSNAAVGAALRATAGKNLRVIDLSGCVNLVPDGIGGLLALVEAELPNVHEINLSLCAPAVVVRALAIRCAKCALLVRSKLLHCGSSEPSGVCFCAHLLTCLCVCPASRQGSGHHRGAARC